MVMDQVFQPVTVSSSYTELTDLHPCSPTLERYLHRSFERKH
jgi:hypothetical protein